MSRTRSTQSSTGRLGKVVSSGKGAKEEKVTGRSGWESALTESMTFYFFRLNGKNEGVH